MHALHRPDLSRAVKALVFTALLAIVLLLAVAGGLNDYGALTGAPAATHGPSSAPLTARHSGATAFTHSPFSPLLLQTLPPPWTQR